MLCTGLFLGFVAVFAFEPTRDFFEMSWFGFWGIVGVVGGAGLAIAGLALSDARFVPEQFRRWTR